MEFDEVNFLVRNKVDLYVDVGANIGQTGIRLRRGGFGGRIVSFEPISNCYAELRTTAQADGNWDTFNLAVGDTDGFAKIGISQNLVSSSLRVASDDLLSIHEPIRYVEHAEIVVRRLDALLPSIVKPGETRYLKVDTQGYERNVVLGAGDTLTAFTFVRLEVAVTEVYVGEMELPEAITMMAERGYVLIEAWPAWRHPIAGYVLHFDLLFRRNKPRAS